MNKKLIESTIDFYRGKDIEYYYSINKLINESQRRIIDDKNFVLDDNINNFIGNLLPPTPEYLFVKTTFTCDDICKSRFYMTLCACCDPTYGKTSRHNSTQLGIFKRCDNAEQASYDSKNIMGFAYEFLRNYFDGDKIKIVDKDHGWAFEVNNTEMGKYGYRHRKEIGWWAYGTGLVNPHLSRVIKREYI